MRITSLATAFILGALTSSAVDRPAGIPEHYRLLYSQDFEKPDAKNEFVATDPTAWKISTQQGATGLELTAQSKYKPAVRSPVNIALIADHTFLDFVLEADLMQTGKEYGHRDMCIFYGFQSPTNFYYTHLATAADNNAHNVFIVNGAPRKNIAKKTTKGVNWGLNVWHKVRLERTTGTGTIKVFFDDMSTPIMEAEDKHFVSGHIGFGSFDDTGMVDNIRVWGPAAGKRSVTSFNRLQSP